MAFSTVVTPAGASLTMYREIRSYANSIWDDNNNNNNNEGNLHVIDIELILENSLKYYYTVHTYQQRLWFIIYKCTVQYSTVP